MNITDRVAQVLQQIDADIALAESGATSRTICPKTLRMLKTAIEGLLQCLESGLNIEKIRWGNDGDCGASNHATDVTYSADTALAAICDQWENAQ